jgi:hypothetical protein
MEPPTGSRCGLAEPIAAGAMLGAGPPGCVPGYGVGGGAVQAA